MALVVLLSIFMYAGFVVVYWVSSSTHVPSHARPGPAPVSRHAPTVHESKHEREALSVGAPRAESPLLQRVQDVLVGCGQVCNTSMTGRAGKFYNFIEKHVDCAGLWSNVAIDQARALGPAPDMHEIQPIMHLYSYNGRVAVVKYPHGVLNQHYAGQKASTSVWTREQIEQWARECGEGSLNGNYGVDATRAVYAGLQRLPGLHAGSILVIGSENPWVEACALRAGAGHVTTIEYGEILSKHPNVTTMTPDTARRFVLNASLAPFDAVVTYSSVEHSGLGRYGDALNPWGDLQAMARAWCLCKPGGGLLLGVMEAPRDRKSHTQCRCTACSLCGASACLFKMSLVLPHGQCLPRVNARAGARNTSFYRAPLLIRTFCHARAHWPGSTYGRVPARATPASTGLPWQSMRH